MVTGPIQKLHKNRGRRVILFPQLDGKNSTSKTEGQGVPKEEPRQ